MLSESKQNLLWDNVRTEDDLKSFELLHDLYYAKLCDFSSLFLKERSVSEEVVSDIFLMLWNKRKELEHINNIQSFLYTCTKNLSIDLLRRNHHTIDLESSAFEIEDMVHSNDYLAESDMVAFREHLQKAVDELPRKCKLIFKMTLNDNLDYIEIADILNLSRKTVETQISIAYKKLTPILRRIYKKDIKRRF